MTVGDAGPGMERRFDFALTYDRQLVTRAAPAMTRRTAATEAGPSPGTGQPKIRSNR